MNIPTVYLGDMVLRPQQKFVTIERLTLCEQLQPVQICRMIVFTDKRKENMR